MSKRHTQLHAMGSRAEFELKQSIARTSLDNALRLLANHEGDAAFCLQSAAHVNARLGQLGLILDAPRAEVKAHFADAVTFGLHLLAFDGVRNRRAAPTRCELS